jgi:3-oxoacyl-[acyl-carrier-protein] synthase II
MECLTVSSAVWITGVGTATPLGHTYSGVADGLLAGHSGVGRVVSFDVTEHPSQIAGQVLEVPCPEGESPECFARLHRLEQLVRWCCTRALRDAGWWERRRDVRLGLVLGVGAEWLVQWESDGLAGGRRAWATPDDSESLLERTRKALGATGPVASVSAACASGNYAIAQARHWLELGWVDVCLAGACDMAVTPMSLAGFGNLRALSRRNADPVGASRPFDKHRDGFVMGEGGAVFVMERAHSARRRSARAYAEVAGCGFSSDAHNMVIPSPDPEPAVAAMRQALADAGVAPAEVDYINAHATSTPVGDIAEARVLGMVFGDDVRRVPISSTKSMTGHLLTAAAAVEALACVVAMERHALPPTINLDEPDPECDLCHVANEARPHDVRVAVSNSFGFGGSNTCLVLRAA